MRESLNGQIARVRALKAQGQWQSALEACLDMLSESRNCAAAMYHLGDLYARPDCPLADIGKAIYWFDAALKSPETYTDGETGKDAMDRLAEIFRAECCPPPYTVAPEQALEKAIELMSVSCPSANCIGNVRDLFDWMAGDLWARCSEDTWTDEENDAANLMSWISDAPCPATVRPGYANNNFF